MQGVYYLRKLQTLAQTSAMVETFEYHPDRNRIYTWISTHIPTVNAQLFDLVQACHACWHERDRPRVQILAAPFAESFAIDGYCNLFTTPITLLIDVGRVIPAHWQRVVLHEYAHAYVGSAGHSPAFATAINHLCLGCGLPTTGFAASGFAASGFAASDLTVSESILQSFPPCTATENRLDFWQRDRPPAFPPAR